MTAQNDRLIDIADVPFTQVPEEEQQQLGAKIREEGDWKGYKPRQYWARTRISARLGRVR